jgi:hypothetical protein
MVSIYEGHVQLGQPQALVLREELIGPELVMGDDMVHCKGSKVLGHGFRARPPSSTANGLERSMFEHIIGGVNETQTAFAIVSETQCQAHHTEAETGSDHQDVLGSDCPDHPIVEKSESQIQVVCIFVVTQRFGELKDVSDDF